MASPENLGASLPCQACRALVPLRKQLTYIENSDLETLFERDDLYPTYPGIASSAQAGCGLCGLMWRRLTSIPPEAIKAIEKGDGKSVWVSSEKRMKQLDSPWDRKVKIRASFDFLPFTTTLPDGSVRYGREPAPQDGPQHGGAVISMSVRSRAVSGPLRLVDGDPWGGQTLAFSVFDSIDLHTPRSEWRRKLPSPVTLSEENVAKVKDWIDECLCDHSLCSAHSDTYWVPRRLLEINSRDRGLEIRLIESLENDLPIGTAFAALSHVWGGREIIPPLRLLSTNFDRLKSGIQESELPKNFIDAARVCAHLGIRYLWIDSLCIIQDSRDDWREQAVLMNRVYRYALVTIVATSATSCHDGFLERDMESIPVVKIAYSLPAADEPSTSDSGYMIIYDYENSQDIWRMFAINGSKWNTRAWTMQERSLSTRMIHFCRNKIFFECRASLQSEENEPEQESDAISSTLWPRNLSTYEELLQHWQLFVVEYTSRNLTVSTDKLPAIQSIAEEMAETTGQKYIRFSGMWESNLRHELLWSVMMDRAKRPDTWRAPSWSWAAVEGQISLWQRDFRNSQQSRPGTLLNRLSLHPFEVLEMDQAYPDPRSTNPGFLKVKSLTKPCSLRKRDESGGRKVFCPYDLMTDGPCNGNEPGKVFAHARLDIDDGTEVNISPTTPGVFLYLHVNDDARATGLLLRARAHDDPRVPGVWTRIGIATLYLDRSATPILEDTFSRDDTRQVITLI
ncbi:heterokaryon incompatibility protein-domain-containing protein [Xylaria intraflava]|nr:heterokaryon incompatibility protein-domain-containing protein [Xylaria intraflava]